MKEILKIIKENFILLFGTGSFTYGLFNLDSRSYSGGGGTRYFYNNESLILLTMGAIFIAIGLLKIKKGYKRED